MSEQSETATTPSRRHRLVTWLDTRTHHRYVPRWLQDVLCDAYDLSLGMDFTDFDWPPPGRIARALAGR